jgi:hypothetical protein
MTDTVNPYEPPASERGGVPVGGPVPGEPLTESMLESLRRTRPWAMFLSILSFVFGGFVGLAALGGVGIAAAEGENLPVLVGVGVFYLVLAAIYLVLGFFLVRYARAIGAVNETTRAEEVEDALWAQQRFWKAAGVVTISVMGLSVVGTIGLIAVAAVVGI